MHDDDARLTREARHRRDIANEIEVQPFIECRVDEVGRCHQEQRVAVRHRFGDGLRSNVGAGPRPVLHDELLTEPV